MESGSVAARAQAQEHGSGAGEKASRREPSGSSLEGPPPSPPSDTITDADATDADTGSRRRASDLAGRPRRRAGGRFAAAQPRVFRQACTEAGWESRSAPWASCCW